MIASEVKPERTDGYSLDGEHSGVVSKSVLLLICASSYDQDLSNSNSTEKHSAFVGLCLLYQHNCMLDTTMTTTI